MSSPADHAPVAPAWEILEGDALARLRELPDEHVQTVVTSPPYWGLRDYGVEGQIGLEDSPEAFIDRLVEVFTEVRRVMRPDATAWINMGDCYAANRPGNAPGEFSTSGLTNPARQNAAHGGLNRIARRDEASRARSAGRAARSGCGRKMKDLIGQPWMLAFALRDRVGLYLRQEIIWHKRSVMPESTRDRPTRSHEQLFLFAKGERYFYDGFAIREPRSGETHGRGANDNPKRRATVEIGGARRTIFRAAGDGGADRNRRSVWTLGPERSPSADHFATFPTKLVEPCVLAGTSARGACAACGAPWRRVLSKASGGAIGASWLPHSAERDASRGNSKTESSEGYTPGKTIGWEPTCECVGPDGGQPATVPCVVLDPFSGTATTGVVALRHGRSYLGIELSPKYAEISRERLRATQAELAAPLFEKPRARARAPGPADSAAPPAPPAPRGLFDAASEPTEPPADSPPAPPDPVSVSSSPELPRGEPCA